MCHAYIITTIVHQPRSKRAFVCRWVQANPKMLCPARRAEARRASGIGSIKQENPMPKFVIERQYLVPMYQHIVVEAENLEEACKKGISDDINWDTQEMDSDNARQTTVTNAKVIPDALELIAGDIILR